MSVTTTHPEYEQAAELWQMMDDAMKGEHAIKDQGTAYLPKTSGMMEAESAASNGSEDEQLITPAQAQQLYQAYKSRAEYPLWVKDSLRSMMGLVSRLEPAIRLPKQMEGLVHSATADGFDLKQLFMRVVSASLTKGRCPLLVDFDAEAKPYVAQYTAESALNWREALVGGRQDLVLVVLQEQKAAADNDEFSHKTETVYRALDLVDGKYRVRLLDKEGAQIGDEEVPGMGEQPLEFIPLVFVGSTDNNAATDEIPLLSMCKAALKYYTLSADYYQSLHYTSHPQPWVSGLDEDKDLRVTGPMAAWCLPQGGTANYLEFTGAGIEASRTAMVDQRNAALEAGARVMDTGDQESGESRKARQSDQYATLATTVSNAAEAIEQCLKYVAAWLGLDPDEVEFSVSPEFTKEVIDSAMLQIVGNLVLAGEVPRTVLFDALRKGDLTQLSDNELESLREGGDGGED